MFNLAMIKTLPVVALAFVLAVVGARWYGYQQGEGDARREAEAMINAERRAAELKISAERATAADQLNETMRAVGARAVEQAQADAVIAARQEMASAKIRAQFSELVEEAFNYDNHVHETINGVDVCGLDADGLRTWAKANAGGNQSTAEDSAAKSNNTMPATAPTEKWDAE